ncbi:MAG: hypothetical protein HOV81_21065 [Kofleriaceae bacterium]|nr:hypothetical protein [Kofleriaceae bacterium]
MIRRVLVAVLLATAAPLAYAEDVVAYQAEGAAPSSSTDARTMALDEAFARAVTTALSDLVAGDIRTSRKGELDREIVGHARLWVAKFSVTKDETLEGRRELTVSVRVDRDRIRARLGELGITTKDVAANSGEPAAKTATILLRISAPSGVRADYGPSADTNAPGVGSMTAVLRNNGYAVRRAPQTGIAPRAEGELPLSDDEADALANEAKADVMAITGITLGAPVPIRGLPTTASLVTANVRVVDRKEKKALGQGSATAAVKGEDIAYAIDRAAAGALTDVMPPAPTKLAQAGAFKGDDTPIAEPGVVLIRLPSRTPYSMVLAEQKYLAGAKGVRAATLRRLSPNGWVIGVATSEPVEQVARIAKKAPATDTSVAVKIVGDLVEVTLSGTP